MSVPLRLLLIEDSEDDATLLLRELRRGGWEVAHHRVETPAAMAAALEQNAWDVIISDYSLPRFSGIDALKMARERAADLPFILVSGAVGEETAVLAMKAGVNDYLFKGNLKRLAPAVERELREAQARREAQRTRQRLQERERQLADALHLARLGTWRLDFGNNNAVWSEEIGWIFGQSEGSAIDFFLGRFHADEKKALAEQFYEADVTRLAQDFRVICADGSNRFVHVCGEITRDAQGQPLDAGGMIQDITERKLGEETLRQARDQLEAAKKDAEAASRAKSEFLANMSHEIRTPMTAVLGFADMLFGPNLRPAERLEYVRVIRRNAKHLLGLINDILDLSKIEAGKMTVEKIECDFPQLAADVMSLLRPRAVEKNLELGIGFDGPIPKKICTDPLRLRQVLMNLIGNAIKFTHAGHVSVRVKCEPTNGSNLLHFEVADSGIGMTEEELPRLFQIFTQTDESTTRKFGGTGLGLTISRKLTHLLGGDITVKSTSGVGSAFSFWIDVGPCSGVDMISDLAEASLEALPEPTNSQDIILRGRILLAEDGVDNQRLISTHLRTAGAEVVIADNGQIAVETAISQPFDLILMDMQMPVMDGYTAVAELRRRGFTVPIIALTAYAMAEDRAKCMDCGCTAYLSKPIEKETFLRTISQYLGNEIPPGAKVAEAPAPAAPLDPSGPIASTMSDHPGMKPIIIEFVQGLSNEVNKMQNMLEQKDLQSLKRVVHQLRGAGGGYGFDAISTAAATAEESIKAAHNLDVIDGEIKSLIDIIRRVEGFEDQKVDAKKVVL